jgi:hypothetical protein
MQYSYNATQYKMCHNVKSQVYVHTEPSDCTYYVTPRIGEKERRFCDQLGKAFERRLRSIIAQMFDRIIRDPLRYGIITIQLVKISMID